MYNTLKRLYLAGRITDTMLDQAVADTWITAAEETEIKAEKTTTAL